MLYVRTEGRSALPRAERRLLELSGAVPRRVLIEEALGFDLLGESVIAEMPGIRGRVLRALPLPLALAWEVLRRRRDYDVVVSWAERFTVVIAGVLVLLPHSRRPRHVAILDWVSKPVVRMPLRLVRRGVDEVLTWSSVQGRAAIDRVGFAPEQIRRIEHPVDEEFFAPRAAQREVVVAAGETQRDFPTLFRAVEGLGVRTVIAANLIGSFHGFRTRVAAAETVLVVPEGVLVKPHSAVELRDAYAAALVVVVPLSQAENNAGISVILEAMAMGRPVIATRTIGQVDVIIDGVNGLYVQPGDADELRRKIRYLWDNPEEADALGRQGRAEVMARHRTSEFISAIRAAAGTAAMSARRSR